MLMSTYRTHDFYVLSLTTIYLSSERCIEMATTIDGDQVLTEHDGMVAALRQLSELVGVNLSARRSHDSEGSINEYFSYPSKNIGDRIFSVYRHVGLEDFAGDEQDLMIADAGTEFLYFILVRDPEADTQEVSDGHVDAAYAETGDRTPSTTYSSNRGEQRV